MDHVEYVAAGLQPFQKVDDDAHIYRKQLIYAGRFFKKSNKTGDRLEYTVSPEAIAGWARTGNKMLDKGVKIPTPKEHTTDVEANRGYITRFEIGLDEKGRKSLYGYVKFRDAESAKMAASSDVSVYAEEETERDGEKYIWPITHVALTNGAVVPDLAPFRAIAASLIDPNESDDMPTTTIKPEPQKNKLSLDDWLKKLGLTAPDGANDETKRKLIQEELAELNSEVLPVPPVLSTSETKTEDKKIAASNISTVLVKQVSKARNTELEQLVREGRITPAVRDKLSTKYCSDEKVVMACSNDNGDDFDDVVAALSLNEPMLRGEQTGDQSRVELSNIMDASKNPLLQDAENRAKAAKR